MNKLLSTMKLMKSMMVNCREATLLIVKKEAGKLSFRERFHLTLHLFMCKFCKAFEKQSAYISSQAKHFVSPAALTPKDKLHIRKSLEE